MRVKGADHKIIAGLAPLLHIEVQSGSYSRAGTSPLTHTRSKSPARFFFNVVESPRKCMTQMDYFLSLTCTTNPSPIGPGPWGFRDNLT